MGFLQKVGGWLAVVSHIICLLSSAFATNRSSSVCELMREQMVVCAIHL